MTERNGSLPDDGSWDTGGADLDIVLEELAKSEMFARIGGHALQPLRTRGLNHAHIRIRDSNALLRIPRLSAFRLDPAANLAYQQACFLRAAPSGVTPGLLMAIAPRCGLPWGALVVREIPGRVPRLPRDLTAIARSLAAIHRLDVPDDSECRPLRLHRDPVRATWEVVAAQAEYLEPAGVCRESRAILQQELRWAQSLAEDPNPPEHPVALVGADTHPGNFLVNGQGQAIFVDLEKMAYGSPAIDLAHASVYTSTMWDEDIAAALTNQQSNAFMETYFNAVPAGFADRVRVWCQPMRRLTWLRTTTWCARWCVEASHGGSWSPLHHRPDYMVTVRERFEDYLNPETLVRVRDGLLAEP